LPALLTILIGALALAVLRQTEYGHTLMASLHPILRKFPKLASSAKGKKYVRLSPRAFQSTSLKMGDDTFQGDALVVFRDQRCDRCDELNEQLKSRKFRDLHERWHKDTLRVGMVIFYTVLACNALI